MNEQNSHQRKLKIGVIFGGRSGEHEVSLQSAQSVMAALDRTKYEVVPIGITRNGRWLAGDVVAALTHGAEGASPATLLPDPQARGLMQLEMRETRPANLAEVTELDVIIPILHGTYGEDGTVQGLLELADMPYVGAGVVGSAVGMDKGIFKQVMMANGIPVLPWKLFSAQAWRKSQEAIVAEIEAALSYPVFTKPANLGSSVGISKCANRDALMAGMAEAARYDRRIVVEQGINGRELEVSVLGNDDPIASVVGEIRPRRDFYDYAAKYLAEPGSEDESELMIPAELAGETADFIRSLAVRAYKAIDCAGMGRVDMLMDRETGDIYLNEINTIPGFTQISMYPKLWAATGISYPELLDRLIELAVERFEEKGQLKRSFGD
ncbi:MAG: D-alanine--D-alanine ligase [Ardenticatenaceae bacterium]|nr:D-alanine--D-alanine ligase [Ardenticatenaceae bacterium]